MPPIRTTPVFAPLWQTTDGETVRLYHGHVTKVLDQLPAQSVQCCVTSPPYWGLRDYGTGAWTGGDPKCDHSNGYSRGDTAAGEGKGAALNSPGVPAVVYFKDVCGKCGARRIDDQLGSEPSPDCGTQGQAQCGRCFVCNLVTVFRGVHRVLRDDGCLWLNLGDSYTSGGGTGQTRHWDGRNKNLETQSHRITAEKSGLPSGNLVGIPWRVALALQADGWILRSDVPWVKRSPMPESCDNRPAKALEYVFLLTKKMGYYFDMDAVRKEYRESTLPRMMRGTSPTNKYVNGSPGQSKNSINQPRENGDGYDLPEGGRNFRNADLWYQSVDGPHGLTGVGDELVGLDVTSQAYAEAHFATFPPRLIEPLILAGTSAHGACVKCGAPWRRVVDRTKVVRDRPNDYVKYADVSHEKKQNTPGKKPQGGWAEFRAKDSATRKQEVNSCANSVAGVSVVTTGWEASCKCGIGEVRPCRVLDPFVGSGTTACVSIEHGRWCWGVDLSRDYLEHQASVRIENVLRGLPHHCHLIGSAYRTRYPLAGVKATVVD